MSPVPHPKSMTRPWPRVETERLVVELARTGLEQQILDYYARNEAHLSSWEPRRSSEFLTIAWWRRQVVANEKEYQHDKGARMVLTLRDDPSRTVSSRTVIGIANLSNVVRGAFHACYLGYSIDAEHEGRGYMREGLEAVIGFAFDDLQLHRIMANYQPNNLRSEALLEHLGFVREGYAEKYLKIDGVWRDHVLTSLVRPEDGRWTPPRAGSARRGPAKQKPAG